MFQEVKASRIPTELAHEDGIVLSPKYRLPLSHSSYPWFLFMLEAQLALGS